LILPADAGAVRSLLPEVDAALILVPDDGASLDLLPDCGAAAEWAGETAAGTGLHVAHNT
jgi:hypothetical protein